MEDFKTRVELDKMESWEVKKYFEDLRIGDLKFYYIQPKGSSHHLKGALYAMLQRVYYEKRRNL